MYQSLESVGPLSQFHHQFFFLSSYAECKVDSVFLNASEGHM